MADKRGRIAKLIQKNLSDIIIYQIKSNVTNSASITSVKLSDDYSYCHVYVTDYKNDSENLASFLNNHKGKIRTLLANTLDIYKVPELSFYADKSALIDEKMKKLLDEVNSQKPKTLKDVYGDDYKENE